MNQTAARPAPFIAPSRTRLLLTYLRGPLAVFAEAVRDNTLPVFSCDTCAPQLAGKPGFWTELVTRPQADAATIRDDILAATQRGRPVALQRIPHRVIIWQGPTGLL